MKKYSTSFKKYKTRKVLTTVFGIALLGGGVIAGIILVAQPQLLSPMARPLYSIEATCDPTLACSFRKVSGVTNTLCYNPKSARNERCCPPTYEIIGGICTLPGKDCLGDKQLQDCKTASGASGVQRCINNKWGKCQPGPTILPGFQVYPICYWDNTECRNIGDMCGKDGYIHHCVLRINTNKSLGCSGFVDFAPNATKCTGSFKCTSSYDTQTGLSKASCN